MDEGNPVASLTEDQRIRLLGFTPPPSTMSLEEAVSFGRESPAITPESAQAETQASAPTKFDQRNIDSKNYTTPVKNQGGCGSCVAFGTVAVMETTYQRMNSSPSSDINLSEAHLFFCHGGEEDRNGSNCWWPDKALEKARDKGIATDDKYPYTRLQQACQVQSGWQNSRAKSLGHIKRSSRAARPASPNSSNHRFQR